MRPAAPISVVLELVRSRGIEFLARDRLLSPDIEKAIALVESSEVVRAVETCLGESLS